MGNSKQDKQDKKKKPKKSSQKQSGHRSRVNNIHDYQAIAYSHTSKHDILCMNAKIKRVRNVVSGKMTEMYDYCGVTSALITYNELEGTGLTVFAGNELTRPEIPITALNQIGNALKIAARHHCENFNPERDNDVIHLTIQDCITTFKALQNNQEIPDIVLNSQINDILNILNRQDLFILGEHLNNMEITCNLERPLQRYTPNVIAGLIAVLSTIIDLDEFEPLHIRRKILPTQRALRANYKLISLSNHATISFKEVAEDDEEDTDDGDINNNEDQDPLEADIVPEVHNNETDQSTPYIDDQIIDEVLNERKDEGEEPPDENPEEDDHRDGEIVKHFRSQIEIDDLINDVGYNLRKRK